jgi:hypothetical protein
MVRPKLGSLNSSLSSQTCRRRFWRIYFAKEDGPCRRHRVQQNSVLHVLRPSIHIIHLAFDHLRIRQVVFVFPNRVLSAPDSAPGRWWRRLSRQEGISKIEVTGDASTETRVSRFGSDFARQGVKLRNIVDTSQISWKAERRVQYRDLPGWFS